MPFTQSARQLVQRLPATDALRITLDYMLGNAVGHANATPMQNIIDHLASNGCPMSREQFQQTILKQTRETDVFIGSSTSGLYLIETIDDARAARDFYENRIQAEQTHLDTLRQLAQQQGWAL